MNYISDKRKVIAIAATDFDGTLYRSDFTISEKNLDTLKMLGEQNILRVIVTGRSFFSLTRVINQSFPVDYYIVSSGSGVYSVELKELIYKTCIPLAEAFRIGERLLSLNCDFMVHRTLPDNHLFHFHRSGQYNTDFEKRLLFYEEHGEEIEEISVLKDDVSQFLVIDRPESPLFEVLKAELAGYTVIRTTSPLDHASSWIEIFPKGTDKGSTLKWLAEGYGLDADDVFSIGNDYNDLHMLRWAKSSFVVANAAEPLKNEFRVVPDNDEDGFSKAVMLWLAEKTI